MTFIEYDSRSKRGGSASGIVGAVMIVLFFVMLYFIARTIFTVLSFAAPVLFIGALILDYKGVIGYGKMLWRMINERPPMGILATVLTVFAFPVVAGFLFFKGLAKKLIKSKVEKAKDDFQEYEEVEDDEDFLELPELEKSVETESKSNQESNDYEQLFD